MKDNDVKEIAANGIFQNKRINGKVEETHISWVILTKKDAFKIKKPLKLSFLNFSTIQLRKQFSEKEVKLNSRFTDIYINVVPIRLNSGRWYMGSGPGKIIDYAVHMKRMMVAKRMDNLLMKGKVLKKDITSLATAISSFHLTAKEIYSPFNLALASNTFNDIRLTENFVTENLGASFTQIVNQSIQWSNRFLTSHAKRIQQRIDHGFKRDVHGDLHSGNIFLYKNPVVFDCIEFNDQYRQIDVLYEIAFFCMDLESFHKNNLAKAFLSAYTRNFQCFEVKEDESIFTYFKCLRANIRAKIHVVRAEQMQDVAKTAHHINETRKYLELMKAYMNR